MLFSLKNGKCMEDLKIHSFIILFESIYKYSKAYLFLIDFVEYTAIFFKGLIILLCIEAVICCLVLFFIRYCKC